MSSESLYANCKTCGKSAAKSASACTHCGAKLKKLSAIHWIGIALVALIVIGIINAPLTTKTESSGFASPASSSSPTTPVLPPAEQKLIAVVSQHFDAFLGAQNELQQSVLRDERRQAITQALENRRVSDWRGKINQLETNTDGKAILSVQISSEIDVKTWNNALSDLTSNTLIDKGAPVYRSLLNLKIGDTVSFSGSFLPSEEDYIKESSMTIKGSMTHPEFLFRFSSVTAVQ